VVDTGGYADPPGDDVELIRVENQGYGAAANVGIERALALGATQIAVLNDDVIVDVGWLAPLCAELKSATVGAVQPMLVSAGSDPRRVDSLGVMIGGDGAGTDIGDGELADAHRAASDLMIFTGGAVLFDAEFLRATGAFDERYFLYYEDVDLALRGASLGYRYRLVPSSQVEHIGSLSTSRDPASARFFQERNRLWSTFRFQGPATAFRAVWLSVRRLRHRPRGVHARALLFGLAGAPRRSFERLRGLDRRTGRQ
jgi:N-acetylglucosaminyl-diphospho-decaprenol L-rhamnosyltransferase